MVYIFESVFGEMFETYEATFEVYVEDELTNKQTIQAPKQILMANFLQTAKQIKDDQRPIKLKMIVPVIIWDEFEQKQKILNNEILISNNAMDLYEEKKGNKE